MQASILNHVTAWSTDGDKLDRVFVGVFLIAVVAPRLTHRRREVDAQALALKVTIALDDHLDAAFDVRSRQASRQPIAETLRRTFDDRNTDRPIDEVACRQRAAKPPFQTTDAENSASERTQSIYPSPIPNVVVWTTYHSPNECASMAQSAQSAQGRQRSL
jgi:hypothetical protein